MAMYHSQSYVTNETSQKLQQLIYPHDRYVSSPDHKLFLKLQMGLTNTKRIPIAIQLSFLHHSGAGADADGIEKVDRKTDVGNVEISYSKPPMMPLQFSSPHRHTSVGPAID